MKSTIINSIGIFILELHKFLVIAAREIVLVAVILASLKGVSVA